MNKSINELSKLKVSLKIIIPNCENKVRERTSELWLIQLKINTELNAIIDHCADGIITVSKDGTINQINPAFERMSALSESKIKNKNFSKIFINDKNEAIADKLNPHGDILLREYKLFNSSNDKFIPVEISFAPIIPANRDCAVGNSELLTEKSVSVTTLSSEAEYFVGVIRDITLQCEMDRLREDFIATLTHDLRTPLLAAIQTLKFFIDGSLGRTH